MSPLGRKGDEDKLKGGGKKSLPDNSKRPASLGGRKTGRKKKVAAWTKTWTPKDTGSKGGE